MKKGGISFDRHQEIGEMLKIVREEILHLSVEFGNAYPVSGHWGRAGVHMDRALQEIDKVRHYAEENYAKEFPDRWTTETYYGGSKEPG